MATCLGSAWLSSIRMIPLSCSQLGHRFSLFEEEEKKKAREQKENRNGCTSKGKEEGGGGLEKWGKEAERQITWWK